MAFRPSHIEGIHYLVSKNSGSFPNWGVYLSGSGGSGKLFAEYRINASVSCSVSSSTTFETGSNYFVDTVFSPFERRAYINIEGNYDAISIIGNGTGSLTTTGSLLLGNLTVSSSQAYSGSIFNTKVYSTFTSGLSNYNLLSKRINTPISTVSKALALVVGGGGGGGSNRGGGGGAGGFILTSFTLETNTTYTVTIGAGGSPGNPGVNGQTSSLADIIAYGGGGGGNFRAIPGNDGASGGGGGGGEGEGGGAGGSAIYGAQGNNGGAGVYYVQGNYGGGGGAGEPGQNGIPGGLGGNGGAGLAASLGGTVSYYAGGGGGGTQVRSTPGIGGIGGGGNGATTSISAQNGTPNTGGGGGGGYTLAGAGGSGIVIIRYPGPPIATGGTITSVDGDTIHTFTATGSSTFTVF
jgi:hypothetical protein